MLEFNQEILETMKKQVKNIKSVYEVCEYCKKGNSIANEEYLKEYPSHKELLSLMERAVTILEFNIINKYDEVITENILNDIEFIISQNILTEAHVKRLLLSPYTLQNLPIFKKKTEDIYERLTELYNCKSDKFYYEYDEFKASLPFNYHQLESYMRYNKVGYEEELINFEFNGDYVFESSTFTVNEKTFEKIHENYNSLNGIDMIDKFKLEQHGIKPIIEHNNQYVHFINGRQYNLYKKDSNYYMITELSKGFKSYKLTIHDEPITLTLESLYGRK